MAFGFVGAVADDVVEDFAAGGFEGAEGVAWWDAAGSADSDVAGGEVFEPVDATVAGVDNFENAYDNATCYVAEVGGADLPVLIETFFIGCARLSFSDVPFDVGGSGGGTSGT